MNCIYVFSPALALERLHLNGRIPPRDQYADIYQQRTIKLIQKVHIPIKDKKVHIHTNQR